MDKIERIKELVDILGKASYAYYAKDDPIMSDKTYDDLYDELTYLETYTGLVLSGSPTHNVQGYVLDKFKKVKHTKPMLSADKTKDIDEIKKFVDKKDFYGSYKLDGATLVLRYEDGNFVYGITRGNGLNGEDVTEQCKFISNIPLSIPYKRDLELRGECVISWDNFNKINATLNTPYSHPRNLASGTLRNLDLNIVKDRKLSFIVFECVTDIGIDSKLKILDYIESIGFEVVERTELNVSVDEIYDKLKPELYKYPVDGIIFEINSRAKSDILGKTAHHENCRMALKWKDEIHETWLTNIEWNTSKTGLINPVAVFDPVDLDGAITTRATLHNISYMEKLELGIGDRIEVYRANMVIPKVHNNISRSNTFKIPDKCPCCGGDVEIHNENGSKTLYCINPKCKAKLIAKLSHFASKNAINIDGLSEQTLQKFVDLGFLNSFKDIYHLSEYKNKIYEIDGFGKKSADKLFENIERSRTTTLGRFIYSLSIPLIGRSASEAVAKHCRKMAIENLMDDFFVFYKLATGYAGYDWSEIDDIGDVMSKSLNEFMSENKVMVYDLAAEFDMDKRTVLSNSEILSGKIFVITGKLKKYKSRNELIDLIESFGGKVSDSVSSKTSYLINNDSNSLSGKNKKAVALGVPIITEDDFLHMTQK